QRFLVRRAVVTCDGVLHAREFDHDGAQQEAAFVRLRRGAAREEPAPGRLDGGAGELRIRRELHRVVDRAIAGNPLRLRHGSSYIMSRAGSTLANAPLSEARKAVCTSRAATLEPPNVRSRVAQAS